MKLKGKVAIVTGGSRGIGKATCLELAKEGAIIVVNYLRSKEKAEETAKEIRKLGAEAMTAQADVSDEDEVKKMVDAAVKAFGRIDILVNNAGVFEYTDSMRSDRKMWDYMIGTNLRGMIYCIQHASKVMLRQKSGAIVNVSSISGTARWGHFLEYEISKAAVNALTKHFAVILAPHVRVNCVAPGGTDTDMALKHSEEMRKAYIQKAPLKRRARPEDIAKVIAFLASEDSGIMTGQIITADSGFTLV
ncbi:MAG: 3-oxoacyl-ACP reductase FabG [Candidatus Aenigmarchaeota archaeon]|nr:3-oxoacyl-ACP reductase FabG [Candidatus Aenigmarchaeota archaeon]